MRRKGTFLSYLAMSLILNPNPNFYIFKQHTLDIVDYKILIMKIVFCLCSNCSCSTFNQPKFRLDLKAQ